MSGNVSAAKTEPSPKDLQQATLLGLPLELRRRIYAYVLIHAMSPTPKEIYFAEGPIARLHPAPIYFVDRQIHLELHAAFAEKKGPWILHITPQGVFYSSFSETQSLAGRCREITHESKFVITV